MSEFMEQCLYFIDCQQGRGISDRFCEAGYITDDRANVTLLFAVVAHPRATALAGAGEVVHVEDSQLLAIGTLYFKDFYIGVIYRDIL